MRKTYLYILSFLLLSAIPMEAAPRLTVFIQVDGLEESNLKKMRPFWSQGGMRTLSEEAYQTTLAFPHPVYGGVETLATLLTGTTPHRHGVAADTYYSRTDRMPHALLQDTQEKGIGIQQGWSARALLTPTLTDYLRMSEGSAAKIFAVGLHPAQTVLLAGHSANACCWLDADSCCWVGTTYYAQGLPSAADDMNMSGRNKEILSRPWLPRMDILTYNSPSDEERKKKGFHYDGMKVACNCPAANELVVELALKIVDEEHMGQDIIPDMLMLEMTALSPKATTDPIVSAEQEDMYLGLNQHIGFLMEQLNRKVGRENYQLVVVGTPALGVGCGLMNAAGLATASLNIDRMAALTGSYLMAIYGHERWVDGGYGQSIYLNRTLIEQKHLSLTTMQRQVAEFLLEFEGIRMAWPGHEAYTVPELSTWVNKRQIGDVVFVPQPGWQLYADDVRCLDWVIDENPTAPLLWWSGAFRNYPQERLTATDILPLILE